MTPQSYETTPAAPHGPREATVQRSLWNTCASGCAKIPGTPASSSLFPILFPIVPSHSFFPQSPPRLRSHIRQKTADFCLKNPRSIKNKNFPLIIDDYIIYACGEQCTSHASLPHAAAILTPRARDAPSQLPPPQDPLRLRQRSRRKSRQPPSAAAPRGRAP